MHASSGPSNSTRRSTVQMLRREQVYPPQCPNEYTSEMTNAPEGARVPESGSDSLPAQQPRRDGTAHEVHRRHWAIHRPAGNADGGRAHAAARRRGRRRRRMTTGRGGRGQKKTRNREATRTRRTATRWRRTKENQRTSARDGLALFNHAPTTYPYSTLDIISVTHARTTRGVAPAHA
jgi:hypothetical protein